MKAKIDRDGNLVITAETENEKFQLAIFRENDEADLIINDKDVKIKRGG